MVTGSSAAGGGVLSRRVPPCVAADLAGGDPLLERGALPGALVGPACSGAGAVSAGTAPARRRSPRPRNRTRRARRSSIRGRGGFRLPLVAHGANSNLRADERDPGVRRRGGAGGGLAGRGDRAHAHRLRASRRRRLGDAGEGLRRRAARRRLPRDARARRRTRDAQVGDLVSPQPRSAGCRWSPARCWSRAPRPASCSRSWTAPRSPRCAPARRPRSRPRCWRARTRATVGLIGCGVNGAWAARCLAAAGYGPGVCHDPRPEAAEALAAELGWDVGDARGGGGAATSSSPSPRRERPVIGAADLRPGQHLAVLGADAHGKAEVELERARALPAVLRRVGAGLEGRRAVGRGRRGRGRSRPRSPRSATCCSAARRAARRRRDHAVRLDRPRDPGPRDRPRRARGVARGTRGCAGDLAPGVPDETTSYTHITSGTPRPVRVVGVAGERCSPTRAEAWCRRRDRRSEPERCRRRRPRCEAG